MSAAAENASKGAYRAKPTGPAVTRGGTPGAMSSGQTRASQQPAKSLPPLKFSKKRGK